MPFLTLKPNQATGDKFRVKGGRYAVALFNRVAGSDIQIMMTDKSDPQAGIGRGPALCGTTTTPAM